jgi:hypothetical protein
VVAHGAVTQAAGALGSQTRAGIVMCTACNVRRVDTAIHVATIHMDSACVVVIASNATATTPVGITIAIVGIAIVIIIVIPGIVPPATIPAVRSVIPRIVEAIAPAGVIPGIIPIVIPAISAIIPVRMPHPIITSIMIACPIGFIVRETIVVETLHLTCQPIVVERVGIDSQLTTERNRI